MNTHEFDGLNLRLIGGLLNLKDKCLYYEKLYLSPEQFNLNLKNYKFIYYHSFFSLIRDICDLTILFITNEELANVTDRSGFSDLLGQLLSENHYGKIIETNSGDVELNEDNLKISHNELRELFVWKYNQILGSHFLDFKVSVFSGFERFMTEISDNYCQYEQAAILKSRKNKIERALKNLASSNDDDKFEKTVDKIIKLPGRYISFPDKINCIRKKILLDKYSRSISKDCEIIDFLRLQRNTIHNSGMHSGESVFLEVNGLNFTLEKNKAAKSDDWMNDIKLFGTLIDIYSAIISAIPNVYFYDLVKEEVNFFVIDEMINAIKNPEIIINKPFVFCDVDLGVIISRIKEKFVLTNESEIDRSILIKLMLNL
jgi:hypothetical protein